MADQAERAARRADATLRMTVGRGLALCLALLAAGQRPVMAEERLRVAVHLHSTVSTGKAQPHQILQWAQQAGLDAVVLTDTLARTWEYGLPPWRWLIKRTVEEPSVMTYGVRRYLSDVADADRASPLMLVAGVEVAPTYYWRRSPLSRAGGELRNWHQHLLVVGLDA